MHSGKYKRYMILICEMLLIALILFPIFMLSMQSIPIVDDFSTAYEIEQKISEGNNTLVAAVKCTVDRYVKWGGFYSAQFFNFLFSSDLKQGFTHLRIGICIINILFAGSLFCFVKVTLKYLFRISDIVKALLVYIFMLLAFIDNVYYSEVYFWYCVSVAYVFLIGLMFLGDAIYIHAWKSGKNSYIIIAAILGGIVSGGALNITALVCGSFLIIACIGTRVTATDRKYIKWIPFITTLIGGIINVASPGNYSRHESVSAGYPVFKTLLMSVNLIYERLNILFSQTPYMLLLVCLYVICLKYADTEKWHFKPRYPAVPFVLTYLAGCVVDFPVLFGYGGEYFPDRCVYVQDATIYIGLFLSVCYLAVWTKQKYTEIHKDMYVCIAIAMVFFACSMNRVVPIKQWPSYMLWKDMATGNAQQYADYWEGVFDEIAHSEDKVVCIDRDHVAWDNMFIDVGLSDDAEYIVNKMAATYYDKNAIVLEIEEN